MASTATPFPPTPIHRGGFRSLLALIAVLEGRAPLFAQRARLTGLWAERLAAAAGRGPAACRHIGRVGTVCDVGLLALPDEVLGANAPPDADGWRQLRRHPEISSWLLGHVGEDEAASWVLAHHERPDGLGYPLGLLDHQIPPESKILSVAGGYAELRVPPPYLPPGREHDEAALELRAHAGTGLDPDVVESLIAWTAPGPPDRARETLVA